MFEYWLFKSKQHLLLFLFIIFLNSAFCGASIKSINIFQVMRLFCHIYLGTYINFVLILDSYQCWKICFLFAF